MSQKNQTLKGFRDIMPDEAVIRDKVINRLRQTFQSFGYQPIETPTLEYAQVLFNKYGQEADKLIYTFQDLGGREVGLRYDLTVPVARFLSNHQNKINFPFKRYQIQNVFRADKPQYGRFREFTQCDIDIFGMDTPLADGEIILIAYTSLINLGFEKFVIKINDRQLLSDLINKIGISKNRQQLSILQSIDKLDKKDEKSIAKELEKKGFSQKIINQIFLQLKKLTPNKKLIQIFNFLENNGLNKNYYQFNPTLVRGLDYYTGPVFEISVTKPNIGSIGGGGRYDNLVSQIGGPNVCATGFAFGLERIVEVIQNQSLWTEIKTNPTMALVTIFSPDLKEKSFEASQKLRKNNINAEVYLDPNERLDKQLQYANRKNIPWVIIIGPEEAENETITLKNMSSGKQEKISLEKAISKLTQSKI